MQSNQQNKANTLSLSSIQSMLSDIINTKSNDDYFTVVHSIKEQNSLSKESITLFKEASLICRKSNEFIKAMIFYSKLDVIIDFFIELSTQKDNSYFFCEFSDFEDALFVLSDYFSKNIDKLSFFFNKAVSMNIYAMFPIFSLVLHNFTKTGRFEESKTLMGSMIDNKMEISTCAINNYIDFLCKNNQIENAQQIFEFLSTYQPILVSHCESYKFSKYILGIGINIVTYGTFIKWLCKSNNLELALYYYQFLKEKKYIKDEVIYNLLIDGCSKKGDLLTLKSVYIDMLSNNIKPTIVTFNTIIDAYVRAKDMDNAWNIFEDLLKNSIQPDNFTLSTLFRGIRLPSHRQYLNKGLDIVNSLSNSNQVADVILINVLLDSCIALKESKRIKEIFNEVREGKFKGVTPDIITYNTFMKGCAQMGLYNEVLEAFDELSNNPTIKPNDVTFNTMIDVFVRCNNMNKVWFIISKMKENNIKPDNFTYSTIIKGLNKNSNNTKENELELAFKLFDNVKKNSKPDEILYNCIMDACLRFGKIEKMLEIYDTMQFEGVKPSSITYGIVIKGYGMKGRLDKALQIYEQMKEEKIELSSVTYGCLINACIKNDNMYKVFELYEDLKRSGFVMNTILYTTLIKAYSRNKKIGKVLEIFETMKSNTNTLPNTITYNSVIDCCLKCGDYDSADKFFNEMLGLQDISPDIITFSTMIKGALRKGDFNKSMKYFDTMLTMNIKPDEVFLNSLLDGCDKLKQYQKGLCIFNKVKSLGVIPSMMSYSIMMKILGKLNNYEYSKTLLEEIKSTNNNLSLIIFTCYIKTCFSTGHIVDACDTFFSLSQFNITPDAIAFNTMINGIINTYTDDDYSNYLFTLIKMSVNQNIVLQRHYYISCIKYMKSFKNYKQANELGKYLEENEILEPRKQNGYNSIRSSNKKEKETTQVRNPLSSVWERKSNNNIYNDETGMNYEKKKKYSNYKGNHYKNYNVFNDNEEKGKSIKRNMFNTNQSENTNKKFNRF